MKINLLKQQINQNPEEEILVTKKRFFEIFFRIFQVRVSKTLSDNEIELLSSLCSDTPTTIGKNNLAPVIKKLNEKGLMKDKDLSDLTKAYKDKFEGTVSIITNFNILQDDTSGDYSAVS